MGARGFNVAEEGHVVSILSPQSISGGVTSTPFHLKYAGKANILVQFGALAGAPGVVILNACSNAAGAGATPIPFTYYTKSTAGNTTDTLDLNGSTPSAAFAATAAGFTPADTANTFFEIVVQSDQLPAGLPYLQLSLASGAVANFASAIAILTGLDYAGGQQPTVTT